MSAATRDMAAIAEAARCAASNWSTKKSLHHAPRPFKTHVTCDSLRSPMPVGLGPFDLKIPKDNC